MLLTEFAIHKSFLILGKVLLVEVKLMEGELRIMMDEAESQAVETGKGSASQ
jgi:hypothetical protein